MGSSPNGVSITAESSDFESLVQHSANVRALIAESLAAFEREEFAGCASDLSALRDEIHRFEAAIEKLQSRVDGSLSAYRRILRTGRLVR